MGEGEELPRDETNHFALKSDRQKRTGLYHTGASFTRNSPRGKTAANQAPELSPVELRKQLATHNVEIIEGFSETETKILRYLSENPSGISLKFADKAKTFLGYDILSVITAMQQLEESGFVLRKDNNLVLSDKAVGLLKNNERSS
jgi:hypothetical protein